MIKSIFFDIDGTLISFKTHTMPKSTKKALNLLREKGVKLFIATGRSPHALPHIKHILDFEFDGYVLLNGQYCIIDDKVIRDVCIIPEVFNKILPYMEKKNISCEFLETGYIYLNKVNDRVLELKKMLGNTVALNPLADTKRTQKYRTYQICPYITKDEEKEFFENMPGYRGVRWNPLFVDVIPQDGGKAAGIESMLKHLGFSKDESMAFGDGGNDIEMLQYVKAGVAMGNAGDDVKEAADYITADVDGDGIYSALLHYGVLE